MLALPPPALGGGDGGSSGPPSPGAASRPPATKNETAGSTQPALQSLLEMFEPVTELLEWKDDCVPAPAHEAASSAWREDTQEDIGQILLTAEVEMTRHEKQQMEAVKGIAFDVFERFLAVASAAGAKQWRDLSAAARLRRVELALARPQIPQRTPAWYQQGKEVLTASEFATLYKSPRAVAQLAVAKVTPLSTEQLQPTSSHRLACMSCEMGPFDWGIRFEPVVKQVLAAEWGAKIAEAGRIVHATETRVAASPDGLIMAANDPARVGRLLEIKCPITRRIGEGVPFDYWCQMQLQMEVCDLDECDYVEVKFVQNDLSGVPVETPKSRRGCLWLMQNAATAEMRYAYHEAEKEGLSGAGGWEVLEEIPWAVTELWAVTVARDRGWFAGTREMRERFWADVAAAAAGTLVVPAAAARGARAMATGPAQVTVTKLEAPCLIVDDE